MMSYIQLRVYDWLYESNNYFLGENVSSGGDLTVKRKQKQKKLRTLRHAFFNRYSSQSLSSHPFLFHPYSAPFVAAVSLRALLCVN